jgi:hypothetical protein
MDCREFEETYWLKVYGEDSSGGETGLAEHLKTCSRCQARKEQIDRMHSLLEFRTAQVPQPEALQEVRQRLVARIEAEKRQPKLRAWGERLGELVGSFFQPRWQPALALGMLILGLLIGRVLFYTPEGGDLASSPLLFSDTVNWEQRYIAERILQDDSGISDLRVRPTESGLVQVSFKGARDYLVEGNPEDELIRELLTWAIKNGDNSGARLYSVKELSKAPQMSTRAREALAYAAINDENDGVRLRALKAMGSATKDKLTEQVILGALLKDPNPAVRISAIDLLLVNEGIDKSESLLLSLAEADSNDYVRMRARQAIRQSDYDMELVDFQP